MEVPQHVFNPNPERQVASGVASAVGVVLK